MLNGISWITITIFLGALLVLYYLWWYWTYEAKRRSGSKDAAPTNTTKKRWRVEGPQEQPDRHASTANDRPEDNGPLHQDDADEEDDEDSPEAGREYKALQGLAGDVTIILQDFGRESDQQALLSRLRQEIRRYPTLQHKPAFRHAINRVIREGALTFCNQKLSDAQLNDLWEEEP